MDTLIWRALSGLIRRLGPQAVLQFGLMLAVSQAAAFGVGEVLRDIDGLQLFPFVAGALLAAWLLHSLRLPTWLAAPLLPLLGASSIMLSLGRLGQPLLQFLRALLQVRLFEDAEAGWLVIWGALPQAGGDLLQAAQGLSSRLVSWWNVLFNPNPAFDPLAAVLTWSLVAWLLAAWLGWLVLRHDQALLGLLPLVALLAWTLYFTSAAVYPLLLVLALGGLLQIVSVYFRHSTRWQAAGLALPDNLVELGLTSALVIGSLAAAALLASSFSFRSVENYLRAMFSAPETSSLSPSDALGKALGLQPQPGPADLFNRALQPTLPGQHLLRGGPELSETVVLWVALDGFPAIPQAAALGAPRPPQYYWRSLAYNRYNGHGWYTDPAEIISYAAGTQLGEAALETVADDGLQYRFIRQRMQVFRQGGGELYYTGELLAVDQDYQVAWRSQANPGDALGALVGSQEYTALSRRLLVDSILLRQAGSVYPDWVIARYLSLPQSLPDRVRDLALDLTATQPTPYERAEAIETYLRKNYTYTVDLPDPPSNLDLVDYFLFDLRSGYCDYYASAMTVLARAAGLPARLVTGYAGGAWVPEQGHLVVTQADAHSWVEIYFPSYGWIEFEPTAGRSPFERSTPEEIEQAARQPVDLSLPARPSWREVWQARLSTLAQYWPQLAVAAWLLVTFIFKLDEWRLRLLKPQAAIALVYGRLYRQAAHLGVRSQPGGTLREFAQRLALALNSLAERGPWQADLARQAEDVSWLSDLYEQALFSSHPLGKSEQRHCIAAWRRMRPRWWLARLRKRLV